MSSSATNFSFIQILKSDHPYIYPSIFLKLVGRTIALHSILPKGLHLNRWNLFLLNKLVLKFFHIFFRFFIEFLNTHFAAEVNPFSHMVNVEFLVNLSTQHRTVGLNFGPCTFSAHLHVSMLMSFIRCG